MTPASLAIFQFVSRLICQHLTRPFPGAVLDLFAACSHSLDDCVQSPVFTNLPYGDASQVGIFSPARSPPAWFVQPTGYFDTSRGGGRGSSSQTRPTLSGDSHVVLSHLSYWSAILPVTSLLPFPLLILQTSQSAPDFLSTL